MNNIFSLEPDEVFQKELCELVSSLFTHKTIGATCDSTVKIQAKQDLKQLLMDNDFDQNKVAAYLKDKNWNENKVTYLLKLLSEKKSTLLKATLQDHNSSHGNGEVITGFNWNIKLILGTSDLKTLKYPILQLLLAIYHKGEHKKISCDISSDVIRKLIHDLEHFITD